MTVSHSKSIPLLVLATWFLGNLGTIFILPLLPQLAESLSAPIQLVQYTLTAFIAGKALGMLVYGPLSEIYGRRRFMLIGLTLYMMGSGLSMIATQIELMIALRFFQGLGVSATLLMGRAIINDTYRHNKAANVFGYLFASAGFIISLLPILGGFIASFNQWRIGFAGMVVYSALITLFMIRFLPETRVVYEAKTLSLTRILKDYSTVLKNPIFLGYLLASALTVAGESGYHTASAFIMIETYGVSEKTFGLMSSALMIAHLAGAALCGKLALTRGITTLCGLGLGTLIGAALVLLVSSLLGANTPAIIQFAMMLYFFGTGFISTTSAVGVVQPFPKLIGTAMAFALFLEFSLSAIGSFISSGFSVANLLPFATLLLVLTTLALTVWFLLIRPQARMIEAQ